MDAIKRLNTASASVARAEFLKCCASTRWAEAMTALRPFDSPDALLAAADTTWSDMRHSDWLEAFDGHPRIGDVASLKEKYGDTKAWAQGEQIGIASAPLDVIERLSECNRAYEARFGHIFIVCATGKSAQEMLAILEARLPNDPEVEDHVAAAEQHKITRIRVEKLLG